LGKVFPNGLLLVFIKNKVYKLYGSFFKLHVSDFRLKRREKMSTSCVAPKASAFCPKCNRTSVAPQEWGGKTEIVARCSNLGCGADLYWKKEESGVSIKKFEMPPKKRLTRVLLPMMAIIR